NMTFVTLAVCTVLIGPVVLKWIGSNKELLSTNLLALLGLVVFWELQFTFWTTLVSTENKIPSLWPTVATQLVVLCFYLALNQRTQSEYLPLILAPLLAGGLFNYWYWLFRGPRSLGTSLWRFLLRKEEA
ncbi:MAG: hypothetical protein ACWGQW_23480, partial [bacterium]